MVINSMMRAIILLFWELNGAFLFMNLNLNEECLLLFLNNPKRLESTTKELKRLIFPSNNTIIIDRENINKNFNIENV